MRRHAIAGILALSMVMTACSSPPAENPGTGSNADSNTVTVWAWDANFNIPIMKIAEEYYKEAGNADFVLNVVEMSVDDVKEKMVASFTAGTTEGLPDIILAEDYDAQSFIKNYEGKFADLTDEIDFSEFAQYKVDALSNNDRTYGIPFDSGSAGLYYRTDYLEQAGYSEEDMQDLTWSEFIQIGKDVKEKTGKWFVVFKPYKGTHYMQVAMQSAGLWYFDENGEIFLKDNPAIREIAPLLKEIEKSQLAKPVEYWDAEGVGAITSGEAAAAISAIWFLPTIKSAEDQSGKWSYTNVPKLETVPGATQYSNLGGSSWFVLEEAPNKAKAIDFMKTVYAGNNEFYQEILTERGAVGTYLPSQSGEAYESTDEFFNKQVFKDFSDWMAEIPGVDYGENTYVAVDAIRAVMQDYFDDRMSLDEMLEAAENYYRQQIGQ